MKYTQLSADEMIVDFPLGVYIHVGRAPVEISLSVPWRLLGITITPTSWAFSWHVYWDNSKWLRIGPLWIVWL